HGLDAAVEIAGHPVGRSDVDGGLRVRQAMAVAERVDTRMFEEAADDRLDADRLRETGYAGPQAADAAHDEIDLDARTAGIVERVDDDAVHERVHLGPDRARAPGFGVFHLGSD